MEEHHPTAMASLQNTDPEALSQADSAHTPTSTTTTTTSQPTTWAQWDSTDAAQLAPANLAVSKVQHAWERRPQSPFARRRFKVGKVWKRTAGVPAPASSTFETNIRPESPLRAVKKMRGAAGEQVVRDWDMRGSPRNRRIVTRSNRGEAQEELLELAEDDVEDSAYAESEVPREEVLRVEIEHEDGTILDLDAEEGEAEAENENWDDESMTEEAVWDATLMHLAATIGEPDTVQGAEQQVNEQPDDSEQDGSLHLPQEDTATEEPPYQATPPRAGNSHPEDMEREEAMIEPIEAEQPIVDPMPPQDGTTPSESIAEMQEPIVESMPSKDEITPAKQLNAELVSQSPLEQSEKAGRPLPQLKPALKQTSQFGAIPAGFVSPIKERKRRTINQVRLSNANRRRTLPVNFAAQNLASAPEPVHEETIVEEAPVLESVNEAEPGLVEVAQDVKSDPVELAGDLLVPVGSASEAEIQTALDDDESDIELGVLPGEPEVAHVEQTIVEEAHEENEWEDVDEEVSDEQAETEVKEAPEQQAEHETPHEDETLPEADEEVSDEHAEIEVEVQQAGLETTHEDEIMSEDKVLKSPTKQDSSPVGSIEGPHPRLPLRRSPRRKSSSPVKRSGILPSASRSHLVAFTPIKLPGYSHNALQSSPLPVEASNDSMDIDNPTPLPQPARSSSAPPEEPQMSPRRPKQPRISDDTALLQAFLNRAAESKTSKDGSNTAKRESIENKRDSLSVRQALASPAPPAKAAVGDVLADLDPNSPSPRKQSLAASLAESAQVNGKSAVDQDEDELALNPTPTKRTSGRKNLRSRRKVAQVLPATTYNAAAAAGPNRISIRSADSVVVLKKTEAQELNQITRNNTRRNKSGAVLPPMRLTRLAAEKLAQVDEIGPPDDDEMEVDVPVKRGRRAVKWAETLESYHEGANEGETSMLSDELNVPAEQQESSAPPASETPSKPGKLRRLRTPRPTASSSATIKTAKAESEVPVAPPAEAAKPPRVTKRSSRIATPAKLPGAAKSLLPDGLDVEEPAPAPAPAAATKKAPVTRKKAPSSKLPAPSSLNAVGKENSLITSPPKKRTTSRSAGAAASLVPKLDFSGSKGTVMEPAVGLGASPAKKSRAQVLFKENGDVSVKRDEPPVLGLGSPAKKRTRRML